MLQRDKATKLLAFCCITMVLADNPAFATNSPIELRTQMAFLLERLTGEFDNAPQKFFEEEYKTPPELVHGRVYRSFVAVPMPKLGPNVLRAEVRYGGKDGRIDPSEALYWIVSVDSAKRAIRMSPRSVANPDAGLPGGPAGCDLWWRLQGAQLVGVTDPNECRSVEKKSGRPLRWDWHWVLTDEELWINFGGRHDDGTLAVGRPDQTHWRLGKASMFDCRSALGLTTATAPHEFRVHDRGGHYAWGYRDANGAEQQATVELMRGMWPSNSGRNFLELLRLQVYAGGLNVPEKERILIGGSHASAASDRAGFSNPEISVSCERAKN